MFIMYKKSLKMFTNIILFILILSFTSCNMNSKNNVKTKKIDNVEIKINKNTSIKINN